LVTRISSPTCTPASWCFRHAAVLAPAYVDIARDALCEREVVVPLDVHRHALAGLKTT